MFRSACDYLASKAGVDITGDAASDEDSSKENSLINGQSQFPAGASPKVSPVVSSPWGHTLTPRTPAPAHTPTALQQRLLLDRNLSSTVSKQNVPWNDLSFAAEVVSPGFASRVVREAQAQALNHRSPAESRRQYPTAQEKFVRAGVLPNVCLGGRTKTVLTPRRTPTTPLLPLGRSSSSTFSSTLSSDFLTSTTPRMPDIRSVASVLEPSSSSSECARDPTSVQAVVAALQQAQVGKGIKRGSCYIEPEDLSKRQKCTTTGTIVSSSMPINYSRDYMEDGQNCSSNGTTSGGGEKRALDLSPTSQGSPRQLSPENKKRCVLDPMTASFSSSKHIMELGMLQANGRDTPFSMYDSRRDTDSDSNPSVGSAHSKNSEQSLHRQTSEATGGDSCIISPGPSERDPSDRSGSHTPQSTRGEGSNSSGAVGNGGTANTSRTSTPRNPTPPRPTHVISLEAYKAEKAKSQQRLKKMLGMLFHVKEGEESQPSKSGESTPTASGSSLIEVTPTVASSSTPPVALNSNPTTSSGTLETAAPSIPTTETGEFEAPSNSLTKNTTEENPSPSCISIIQTTSSEGTKSEVSASFTLSLKPPSISAATSKDIDSGNKDDLTTEEGEGSNNVSVTAMFKLPATTKSDSTKDNAENEADFLAPSTTESPDAPISSPSLVDFLKATSSAKNGTAPALPLCGNTTIENKTSTQPTSVSESNQTSVILPLTLPSSTAVSQGSTGVFTFGQTSVPSMNKLTSTPSVLSLNFPHAVSSVANTFSFTAPSTTNFANSPSRTVEDAPSSSKSVTLTFGSGNTNKPVDFQQSSFEVTSSCNSITSTGSVMSSGFFSNTPITTETPTTTQVGFDASAITSTVAESSSNSSGGLFNFGSRNIASTTQQSPFPFLDPKKLPSSTDSTTLSTVNTTGFSFGTSQTSASPVLPFGSTGTTQATPSSTSSGFGSGLTFSSQTGSTAPTTVPPAFGLSTASVTGPPPFCATAAVSTALPTFSSTSVTPSTSASNQASHFTFGQTMVSPSTTTASSLPFAFGSTSTQVASGSSSGVFQFGKAAAPAATVTLQSFTPAVASTQSNTATSSLFAFDAGGTNTLTTAAPSVTSPYTFGPPKTNTTAPAFGSTTNTSAKPAAPSGFSFSSVPTATTTSAPTTGFTFVSPASSPATGFQFGSSLVTPSANIKSSSPFTFGSSAAKTSNFGASTASPFSFGGSATAAPSFGTNQSQNFGAPTTGAPTFGTSTPSFGTTAVNPTSPFGSTNAFAATSPSSSFNPPTFAPTPNNKTGSGANLFGAQGASPSFVSSNNPAPSPSFGNAGAAGRFSTPQASTFGGATFNSDKNVTDKSSAFQFGQGANGTPSFPASPSTFGGGANPSTFAGATSPPTFAGVTSPTSFVAGPSATGTSGGPVFQFGSSNPPSFNAGNTASSVAPRRPRARVPRRHR